MSSMHANDGHVAALGPEVQGPMIAGEKLFAWLDDRPRKWDAAQLTRRLVDRMTVPWLLAGFVLAAFLADACAIGRGDVAVACHPIGFVSSDAACPAAFLPRRRQHGAIVVTLFLAPAERWPVEASNRAVFACLLWLAAAWVVRHRTAVDALKRSERRSLQLKESLEQRVRERTAQLEAANKELEAFACSVSHDLRAPLRAMDGFAQILEEEHAPQLDEQGRRVLSVVRSEARRMGQLIDDLLAFSRVGRHDMHLTDTDMTALVREVFDQVKGRAADRQVDFRLGELPVARADLALLRQVWINLLDNALKYTRHRARVQVSITGAKRGEEIVYSIRDNGAGFDMKYAGKLFGVFQRLHGTEEFEGTGVGLALVQRIIRRHGGRVERKPRWNGEPPSISLCHLRGRVPSDAAREKQRTQWKVCHELRFQCETV